MLQTDGGTGYSGHAASTKISRGTARQQYYARYPQRGVSYASTVTQTGAGNRVTSEEASLANRKGRGSEII